MSLYWCQFTLDIVVESDGPANAAELARRFVDDERGSIRLESADVVTAVEQIPRGWRNSLPYREPNVGPELTCRQILEDKS